MPAVNTLPPPVAPGPVVQHDGPLMQLSGKGLLAPGSWKRRYCVLDGRRLYYYQLKEENQGHQHYRDKTSHYVDLDGYDICEEAKGIKTASNVLVISSSEIEKSFFDTVIEGRLYLSAETAAEMSEWISQIRKAMTTLRDGQNKKTSSRNSSKSADTSTITTSSNQEATGENKCPVENSISLLSSGEHLDCITKQRAKGPTGRRLPRAAKSRLYPAADVIQQQQRSESLPKLEEPVVRLGHIKHAAIPSNRLISRMMELDDGGDEAAPVNSASSQVTSVVDEGQQTTVPDHSSFDQSWFLQERSSIRTNECRRSSSRASALSSTAETPLAVGPEQLNCTSPTPKSSTTATGVAPRQANRYSTCNFL